MIYPDFGVVIYGMSREQLEDHFLRLKEENLKLKEHANKKEDEIKKLATRLKKMENDNRRLARLSKGSQQLRSEDQQVSIMVEDLQQKVQNLQRENEELKQRDHMARQVLGLHNGKNPTKDASRLGGRGKHPTGPLEEAKAQISRLKKNDMLQQSNIKELEDVVEQLKDKLREKDVEHEKEIVQIREQEATKIWSHIEHNITLVNLQKQLADKSTAMEELQEELLQMQESQRTFKENYQTTVVQMKDLLAQLNDEKQKSSQLDKQMKALVLENDRVQRLQPQLTQAIEERDMLREKISKLHKSTCHVCEVQKLQIQELELQLSQLQTALKVEIVDKNSILNKVKSEQEFTRELTAKVTKLKNECWEKQQKLERYNRYMRESECSEEEFNEALLLFKTRKNRREVAVQTTAVVKVEDGASSTRERQDADTQTTHTRVSAQTTKVPQTSRKILRVERLCKNGKQRLDDVTRKMNEDQAKYQQMLAQQAQQLDGMEEKVNRLEAKLEQTSAPTCVVQPEVSRERETNDVSIHQEGAKKRVEFEIIGARLSPTALEHQDKHETATFCTYSFYGFNNCMTSVAMGQNPEYNFKSACTVNVDDDFSGYVNHHSVLVQLHQKHRGHESRIVACARLPLWQLLENDGKVEGTVPLVCTTYKARALGSLDYCIRWKPVKAWSSQ